MKLNNQNGHKEQIDQIIEFIESQYPAVVVWRNTGTFSDNFEDNTEVFEAYNVLEEDYEEFLDIVWKSNVEIAKPNGFEIMVHELTPEETEKYRQDQYQKEIDRRKHGRIISEQFNSKTIIYNIIKTGYQVYSQNKRNNFDELMNVNTNIININSNQSLNGMVWSNTLPKQYSDISQKYSEIEEPGYWFESKTA